MFRISPPPSAFRHGSCSSHFTMAEPKLSVVVPTRNRPERLRRTLAALGDQQGLDGKEYELIVVDDGSIPPATLSEASGEATVTLVRLEGEERSVARNRGAECARGELIVFVDDDIRVSPTFLASHWDAHLNWPGALQVGSIQLPDVATATPFGAFRQRLEEEGVPDTSGPVAARNFCTAQHMAVEQSIFRALGGFDPALSVAEDQDLALRHSARGGGIVFVSSAAAIHDDDSALTLGSYGERAEFYMQELVRFGAQHPDWPENAERARVNGPVRWG